MSTVKELFENEELMNNIVEDLDEVPRDAEVFYAVWALGRDDNNSLTSDEVLLGEFTDPDIAVEYAGKVDYDLIREMGYGDRDLTTTHFSIEVETVVGDPEDEDNGTMNIGTIYQRELPLSEESIEEDPLVEVTSADYELLDDGMLKVKRSFMKDFNKDDYIRFKFIDEADTCPLLYKIISTINLEDGDYFLCLMML